MQHLLTIIILLPLAGALATVSYSLLPSKRESNYKWIALVTSVVNFALSLMLIRGAGSKDFSFADDVLWIGSIGAHYHVGVDGISLWLVILTTLLMPIAILSSWTAIQKHSCEGDGHVLPEAAHAPHVLLVMHAVDYRA